MSRAAYEQAGALRGWRCKLWDDMKLGICLKLQDFVRGWPERGICGWGAACGRGDLIPRRDQNFFAGRDLVCGQVSTAVAEAC